MRTLILLLMMMMIGCASCASVEPDRVKNRRVETVGAMRDVMQKGDLSARISLDALAGLPHLYALGPLEGLKGEITIFDGVPSIATVEAGEMRVTSGFDHKAPFLVVRAGGRVAEGSCAGDGAERGRLGSVRRAGSRSRTDRHRAAVRVHGRRRPGDDALPRRQQN